MRRPGKGLRLLGGVAIAICVILQLLPAAAPVRVKDFKKTCKELPGANEVFVVFKTGATEFAHKFPVHLNTTLQCYPNYMVFSDHHEVYQGQTIHDALEPISGYMKVNLRREFELYHRIKEGGRQILNARELSDRPDAIRHKSAFEAYADMGWRLDKWKFLPMYQTAYETYPDFKWYLFIEADTYVFWSSLLQYIATLDHRVAAWYGADLFVAGTIIANGGAGTLVSNPAMKLFSKEYQYRRDQWTRFMDDHKAGDVVLARVMNVAGLILTKSRPLFNPEAPGNDTYRRTFMETTQWCSPVITYHHVGPQIVRDMWDLEQELYGSYEPDFSNANSGQQVPKYRDVFLHYIYPQILQGPRDLWDNNCQKHLGERASFQACRQSCEENLQCLQYRYDSATKQCFVHDKAQLGDTAPVSSWTSGWMEDRVQAFIDQAPTCERRGWPTVLSDDT